MSKCSFNPVYGERGCEAGRDVVAVLVHEGDSVRGVDVDSSAGLFFKKKSFFVWEMQGLCS